VDWLKKHESELRIELVRITPYQMLEYIKIDGSRIKARCPECRSRFEQDLLPFVEDLEKLGYHRFIIPIHMEKRGILKEERKERGAVPFYVIWPQKWGPDGITTKQFMDTVKATEEQDPFGQQATALSMPPPLPRRIY